MQTFGGYDRDSSTVPRVARPLHARQTSVTMQTRRRTNKRNKSNRNRTCMLWTANRKRQRLQGADGINSKAGNYVESIMPHCTEHIPALDRAHLEDHLSEKISLYLPKLAEIHSSKVAL